MDDKESDKKSPDVAKAIDALHEAAKKGSAEAQFRLGVIYGNGDDGIELDQEAAMSWFKLAARQGHENALITMALTTWLPRTALSMDFKVLVKKIMVDKLVILKGTRQRVSRRKQPLRSVGS